jgi:hypothetical protein
MALPKSPSQPDTSAAAATVKLDAAALRKLVVSTVVTVETDEDDGDQEAANDRDAAGVADKPRAR